MRTRTHTRTHIPFAHCPDTHTRTLFLQLYADCPPRAPLSHLHAYQILHTHPHAHPVNYPPTQVTSNAVHNPNQSAPPQKKNTPRTCFLHNIAQHPRFLQELVLSVQDRIISTSARVTSGLSPWKHDLERLVVARCSGATPGSTQVVARVLGGGEAGQVVLGAVAQLNLLVLQRPAPVQTQTHGGCMATGFLM